MSSFQVYLPGKRGATPDHLRAVGLERLLDDQMMPTAIEAFEFTPDGSSGVVFYWQDLANPHNMPQHLGCHPDQEWTPAKPKGDLPAARFWLGKDRGGVITPAALARSRQLDGDLVDLDDGHKWLIPKATRAPKRYSLDEQGVPRLVVYPEYQQFYDLAAQNFAILAIARQGEDITLVDAWNFAERALAYNYRINSDVIDWLGLLGQVSMLYLIGATFEYAALLEIEAQKKTAELSTPAT